MKTHGLIVITLCSLVAVGCGKAQPTADPEARAGDVAPAAAQPEPAAVVRVALVGTDSRDGVRNILDLTGAVLTREGASIELFERQQIERVLVEQKLSLNGLLDGNQVVAVGKVLAVDLFAVVEASADGKEAIGLVVFDARSGARLWDAALPRGELKNAAASAEAGVRQAARKYRVGLKPLQPLCLLSVRNADLPADMDSVCESVARIVERRLVSSESVVLLERKRLEQWNQEKSLPREGPAADLLASLHFLELEISRGREGRGVRAHVYLTDNKGQRLGDVVAQAQANDAADLVAPLLAGILQKLKAAPAPAASDRVRESGRFLREAQVSWSHKLWKQALEAAEAAHALDPDDPQTSVALAENLVHYAVYRIDPKGLNVLSWGSGFRIEATPETLTTALRLAQRGLGVQDAALHRLKDHERRPLAQHLIRYMGPRRALRSFLNKLVYVNPTTPECRQALVDFRAAVEQLLRAERDAWAEGVSKHPGQGDVGTTKGPQPDSFFSQYSHLLQDQLELLTWNAPDAAAHARVVTEAGKQWLEAASKQDPKSFQVWHLNWFLETLFRNATFPMASWTTPNHVAKTIGLFEAMAAHPYPLISLYGRCGVLHAGVTTHQFGPDECRKRFQDVKQQTFRLIQKPPVDNADQLRAGCYKFLVFAIVNLNLGGADVRPAELFEVCDFMLERKELAADVAENALNYGASPAQERRRFALIQRAMAAAVDPQVRVLSGLKQAMKDKLLPAHQKLLTQFPDLAPAPAALPWDNARLLFDTTRVPGIQVFLAPTLAGEHVYVIGCGLRDEQGYIRLIRIALADGVSKVLGETDVTLKRYGPGRASYGIFVNPSFVRGIAVGESALYVGTISDGIYAFGAADGAVRRIGEKEGLPADAVDSLTFHAGKVYAGLAGGYLVSIDDKTRAIQVLASSRRKEKLSPFDDLPSGFSIPYIVADPRRDRLLFALYENTNQDLYQVGPKKNSPAGLWELKLKTSAYTRRLRFYHQPRVRFGSGIRDDHLLLSDMVFALDYDLAKDQAQLLWAFNRVGPELGLERAKCKDYMGMNAPRLYRNGWLWSDRPFSRWNPETRKQEILPRLGKPHDANPFQPREAIEPLGTGDRLLVADLFSLWIVTLTKGQ